MHLILNELKEIHTPSEYTNLTHLNIFVWKNTPELFDVLLHNISLADELGIISGLYPASQNIN